MRIFVKILEKSLTISENRWLFLEKAPKWVVFTQEIRFLNFNFNFKICKKKTLFFTQKLKLTYGHIKLCLDSKLMKNNCKNLFLTKSHAFFHRYPYLTLHCLWEFLKFKFHLLGVNLYFGLYLVFCDSRYKHRCVVLLVINLSIG